MKKNKKSPEVNAEQAVIWVCHDCGAYNLDTLDWPDFACINCDARYFAQAKSIFVKRPRGRRKNVDKLCPLRIQGGQAHIETSYAPDGNPHPTHGISNPCFLPCLGEECVWWVPEKTPGDAAYQGGGRTLPAHCAITGSKP